MANVNGVLGVSVLILLITVMTLVSELSKSNFQVKVLESALQTVPSGLEENKQPRAPSSKHDINMPASHFARPLVSKSLSMNATLDEVPHSKASKPRRRRQKIIDDDDGESVTPVPADDDGGDFYDDDEVDSPKPNPKYKKEPFINVRVRTKDKSVAEIQPGFTYKMCSRLLSLEEKKRTLYQPMWVHFPKCGTSFGIILHNHGCVSKHPPGNIGNEVQKGCICGNKREWDVTLSQGDYIPWKMDKFCTPEVDLIGSYQGHNIDWHGEHYHKYRGKFVTTFRDPRRRLVSAYNDQKHSFGLPQRLTKALHDVTTLKDYVALPGIQGCMTKMVLGHYCADVVQINEQDLEEAKRRLHDYAFIGLVEYWTDSMCLFNAMFGGKVRPNTMSNSRSATGYYKQKVGEVMVGNRAGKARYIPSSDWSTLSPEDDPADWELYQEAKRIFFARMKEYGLHPLPSVV